MVVQNFNAISLLFMCEGFTGNKTTFLAFVVAGHTGIWCNPGYKFLRWGFSSSNVFKHDGGKQWTVGGALNKKCSFSLLIKILLVCPIGQRGLATPQPFLDTSLDCRLCHYKAYYTHCHLSTPHDAIGHLICIIGTLFFVATGWIL